MTAIYRGQRVRIVGTPKGGKVKIAMARGVRWAQLAELDLLP